MNRIFRTALLLTTSLTFGTQAFAQDTAPAVADSVKTVRKKLYWGSGLDMFLFSTSMTEKVAPASSGLTPLRFTYLLNLGFNLNYDFSKNVGIFSGIGMKNVGFIEKFSVNDSTVKRRVLALGIPIGIKFGNLHRHTYGFIGGGVDFPFNYKEKGYIRRGNKEKFNEWFSERTEAILPYIFAGIALKPGLTLKAQYYPTNFINNGYASSVTLAGSTYNVYPYSNFVTNNILMLSVGFDVRYSKKSKKVQVTDTPEKQTM